MARKKSKIVKLNILVPPGVKIANSVFAEATRAAQVIVSAHNKFAVISQDLAEKGIDISPRELAKHSAGAEAVKTAKIAKPAKADVAKAPKAKSSGKRRRTVLSTAQRGEVVAMLRSGSTIAVAAKNFKCSPQTVMVIKKEAGLVKSKKAVKKRK